MERNSRFCLHSSVYYHFVPHTVTKVRKLIKLILFPVFSFQLHAENHKNYCEYKPCESIKVDFNLFVAFSKIDQEIQNRKWFCNSPQHFMYFKSAVAIGKTSCFETVVTS